MLRKAVRMSAVVMFLCLTILQVSCMVYAMPQFNNENDPLSDRYTPKPSARYSFAGDARDVTANGNDGTIYSAALTTDRFGDPNSAFYFNGSNSYISVPYSDRLMPTDVTVTAWIKTGFHGFATILTTQTDPSTNTGGYCLRLRESGKIWFGIGSYGTESAVESNSSVNDDTWVLVCGVKDGIEIKVYIDGVLQGSGRTDYALTGKRELSIGKANNDIEYFSGNIDDVSIYPAALSDERIADIYADENSEPY